MGPSMNVNTRQGMTKTVGHAVALCVADLPRADEQIEGEVVHPARQQQGRIGEQTRDVGERTEAAVGGAEVLRDEHDVDERDRQRDRHAGHQVRDTVTW